MPLPVPTTDWKSLGEQLVRQRIELDPRYSNRQLFATERGVNYRTLSDIEHGRRDNYEPATLSSLEVAYALAPGSISRAAYEGIPLEPAAPPAERPRPHLAEVPPEGPDDAFYERVALNIIAKADDPRDRRVMEAMWAGTHQSARLRIEKMLDWERDDPRKPIDWDKRDDGNGHARNA